MSTRVRRATAPPGVRTVHAPHHIRDSCRGNGLHLHVDLCRDLVRRVQKGQHALRQVRGRLGNLVTPPVDTFHEKVYRDGIAWSGLQKIAVLSSNFDSQNWGKAFNRGFRFV